MTSTDDYPQPQTVDEIRDAWDLVDRRWRATIERACRLPHDALHERVDGEWSFVETLRHGVYAIDAWFRYAVLDRADAFWSGALAHTSFRGDRAALGIDERASPTLDDVLAVRAERDVELRSFLTTLTPAELERPCAHRPPGIPDDFDPTVLDCLSTVIEEAWLHNDYADRDLAILAARRSGL
jgi:hypothetical protein